MDYKKILAIALLILTGIVLLCGGVKFFPVTVIAAILLFFTKEVLEFVRKIQASKRFKKTIRILLKEELGSNLIYLKELKSINQFVLDAGADKIEDQITVTLSKSGRLLFIVKPLHELYAGFQSRYLQPEFITDIFDKNTYQIALHDKGLVIQLASIYSKINKLKRNFQYISEYLNQTDYPFAEAYAIAAVHQIEAAINEMHATGILENALGS